MNGEVQCCTVGGVHIFMGGIFHAPSQKKKFVTLQNPLTPLQKMYTPEIEKANHVPGVVSLTACLSD